MDIIRKLWVIYRLWEIRGLMEGREMLRILRKFICQNFTKSLQNSCSITGRRTLPASMLPFHTMSHCRVVLVKFASLFCKNLPVASSHTPHSLIHNSIIHPILPPLRPLLSGNFDTCIFSYGKNCSAPDGKMVEIFILAKFFQNKY